MPHEWSWDDDVVALYVSLYTDKQLPLDEVSIGDRLGMGAASFRMRVQNFNAIRNGRGLSHFAQQSLAVFDELGAKPRAELRKQVIEILEANGPIPPRSISF